MTPSAQAILELAFALPEDERRRVGEALLDSVPEEPDETIEKAWRDEAVIRVDEIRSGEVQLEPWAEVRRLIYRCVYAND